MTTSDPAARLAQAEAHYRDLIQRRLRATKRLTADLAPRADALAAQSPQLAAAVAAVLSAAAAEERELRMGRHDSAALVATEAAMDQLDAELELHPPAATLNDEENTP